MRGGAPQRGYQLREPERRDQSALLVALVGFGALVFTVALLSTGVMAEYAFGFAGAGFMVGLGAGAALGGF